MSEILAWDGPWCMDLINAMFPVAVEIEAKREQAFGRPMISAVASLVKGGTWKEYSDSLKDVLAKVQEDQLTVRGATKEDLHALAAEELVAVLSRMQGIKHG